MLVYGILLACVVLTSSFVMDSHDKMDYGYAHTHHKHPDQTIVDSIQARNVFAILTKGNYTLSIEDFKHFLAVSDKNGDGKVTSDEFLKEWYENGVGAVVNAVPFFINLDANKDHALTVKDDLKIMFGHFDRNDNGKIDEGEFVVQWVKMSSV